MGKLFEPFRMDPKFIRYHIHNSAKFCCIQVLQMNRAATFQCFGGPPPFSLADPASLDSSG